MDSRRYPYQCGHATIGAVIILLETGALPCEDGDRTIVVDTASGPMDALARGKEGRGQSVAIRMVPTFVHGNARVS